MRYCLAKRVVSEKISLFYFVCDFKKGVNEEFRKITKNIQSNEQTVFYKIDFTAYGL